MLSDRVLPSSAPPGSIVRHASRIGLRRMPGSGASAISGDEV
jgi:hypothetical protein